jgi:hypothetical protein
MILARRSLKTISKTGLNKGILALIFGLITAFSSSGQETLEDFGRAMFTSLKQNSLSQFLALTYKESELRATIAAKTQDPKVKEAILKELKEGFNQKMVNGGKKAFETLLSNKYSDPIEWSAVQYVGFEFEENERRSEMSGISMGRGKLVFAYDGRNYVVAVDKMSKLLVGWRGNEFDSTAKLEYRNQ